MKPSGDEFRRGQAHRRRSFLAAAAGAALALLAPRRGASGGGGEEENGPPAPAAPPLPLLPPLHRAGPGAILRPPPLRPGDPILILSPASPVPPADLDEAVRNLQRLGYRPRVSSRAADHAGYLAGDDAARAADLNAAFDDPEARAIICSRGGYGTPRLLDRLDYSLLRRRPKIVVGFSDITALLIAIQQRAGIVAFHGPMAAKDFSGRAGLSPFAARHFFPLLGGIVTPGAPPAFDDWGANPPGGDEWFTLAPGEAEGRLTGGNLSTIAALLGTPFEIDTRGAILFLEDVNEEPFRIDRMLCQLRLAGKLAEARGVILGAFTRCVARSPKESLSLEEIFAGYFRSLGVPVLGGFPCGHLPEQATLPLGVRVRLDATRRTLSLLEPAVEDPPPSREAGESKTGSPSPAGNERR